MTDKVEQEKVMSFWGHFDELRKRLFIGLIAMVITTLASFAFAQRLIFILAQPVGGTQNLLSIEVTENMGVFMRVSLLSGFVIALPVIFYEVMAFVLPGLHASEKKWVFMMIPLATLLFVIGVLFAYFVMLPTALPFLINFLGIKTTPRLSSYFSFVTGLLFWIGISFETPLVVFFLAKLKLVAAKGLARQWRVAVVVIAVLAAVITPTPDPVNMGLLMLPLFGLYLLSLLLATLAG
jgi:sec-independent protein translocase protein TatC